MKRTAAIALAIFAALVTTAAANHETVKNDPMKTQIYTLDNGLKVYLSVNKQEPRIQTYIAVRVGGKNDPSETTGLAHYFEHLMFKGTQQFGTSDYAAEKPLLDEIEQLFETYRATKDEKRRAGIYARIDSLSFEASRISIPNEYDKLMSVIGAQGTNAWTSHDETVYQENIPSNQVENWARVQADRFKNIVIRGFHTELETIYEEKNMSLTKDSRKVWEALDQALFPHHPYGRQTVLGTQEHLKNPSITNVKKYHDQYYVPNNVAICASGDLNPDEFVAVIEKYFGDWQPNPDIPVLKYEKESPLTAPVVKQVYGLEAENIMMGWRLKGKTEGVRDAAIAGIAGEILNNGKSGLIDLDVVQKQRALGMYGGYSEQPDYSTFLIGAMPKEGQSLEELRDIALEEVAKLRNGEFDEAMLKAIINNVKLSKMRQLESNAARANAYVDAFISRTEWKDVACEIDLLASISKEDVVKWASENLGADSYAIVYKLQGEDKTVQKISAPKITPIATNRDMQSAFLTEIAGAQVKPIQPEFVNFRKSLKKFSLAPGIDVLYTRNKVNDIANISIIFYKGSEEDPALPVMADYIDYLGTPSMSAEQRAAKLYELACSFSVSVGANKTTIRLNGLNENIAEALRIVEDLFLNAAADEEILAGLKIDEIKARGDSKKNQASCFNKLRSYVRYGADFIARTTIKDEQINALTSGELLAKAGDLFNCSHEILFYGPDRKCAARRMLRKSHVMNSGLKQLEETYPEMQEVGQNNVVLAQYDAKQLYYDQFSNRGEEFDRDEEAGITLYNEYFGGGMNTIVFQEMREARGLAYSAWASLDKPSHTGGNYSYTAFIATQNDKMQQAIEAFDEIINNMPESQAAFDIAKEGIISRIRTQRTTGPAILDSYLACRRLGLETPLYEQIFKALPAMTMEDVKAVQQKWVKDRCYTYSILGDIKDLDTGYLRTLGPVKEVTLEDIFGY